MEDSLEDRNVISGERWQAWAAKGRQHDRAVARTIKFVVAGVISLVVVAAVSYLLASR